MDVRRPKDCCPGRRTGPGSSPNGWCWNYRAQTPKASKGRTAPLADRPSDHRLDGETRTVPDGYGRPVLVASAWLVVHGPTNEPRRPFSVVMAPCRNWLIRNACRKNGSGMGVPVLSVKSSCAEA